MLHILDPLRELTVPALLLRLFLAVLFGGAIGINRSRKQRAAGFRTYMLVCVGAALTLLLGQYATVMLAENWQEAALAVTPNLRVDITRLAAKVMSGIGFLAAGTVLLTGRQEVKGATTAAGLWASACMGITIGAGFYEGVIIAFLLILVALWVLPLPENLLLERAKNMNIFIEFESVNNLTQVIETIKANKVHIYDIDIDRRREGPLSNPGAVIMLSLDRKKTHLTHARLISELSEIDGVHAIKEVT